jgi:hypothetical protein
MAQGSSQLLETHIPLIPPTLNCATKISSLPLARFCHHGQMLSSFLAGRRNEAMKQNNPHTA